jgi:hypothetical protein
VKRFADALGEGLAVTMYCALIVTSALAGAAAGVVRAALPSGR